tara:strand:+ start:242 stop:520 length:279 start_codon:yes stop_codon:yes gene_type:complete
MSIGELKLRKHRKLLFKLMDQRVIYLIEENDNTKIPTDKELAIHVGRYVGLEKGDPLINQLTNEYTTWKQTLNGDVNTLRDYETKNNTKTKI